MADTKFTIFNIGKANERINELTARLAQLESGDSAAQLSEALASNEVIAAELNRAKSETIAASSANAALAAEKKALSDRISSVNALLNSACRALLVADGDEKAIAGMDEAAKITAIQNATNNAVAKTGVDIKTLPAASAKTAAAPVDVLAQLESINDPILKTLFYRKNKAAIRHAGFEGRAKN